MTVLPELLKVAISNRERGTLCRRQQVEVNYFGQDEGNIKVSMVTSISRPFIELYFDVMRSVGFPRLPHIRDGTNFRIP